MVPVAVGDFHWSTKRAIRQIRNRGERQKERREREGGGGIFSSDEIQALSSQEVTMKRLHLVAL